MALQDENEAFYFIKNPNGKITVRITEKDDVYPGEIETGFFSLNKEEARRFIDILEASAKECWGDRESLARFGEDVSPRLPKQTTPPTFETTRQMFSREQAGNHMGIHHDFKSDHPERWEARCVQWHDPLLHHHFAQHWQLARGGRATHPS